MENLEVIFIFSVIWSIGNNCNNFQRIKFQTELRGLVDEEALQLPENNLFDYEFDYNKEKDD